MGKNRRAAKAARAAAAAAATTTSLATPLVSAITQAAPAAARDSRATAPVPTQQQHAPDTRPAPHASSAASQTTRPSSTSVPTPHSDPTPPFASEHEPIGSPTATNHDSCSVTAHPAPPAGSLAPHAHTATPNTSCTPCQGTPSPQVAVNEPADRAGAREDCAYAAPHAAPSARCAASSDHHHVPASAHHDTTSPTPGFEPGEPRTAAASEPLEDPALLDATQVDEIVATALRKGYDAGLKEGRNTGFREGLQAGRRTGVESGKELGYEEGKAAGLKEGREQGRLEVSTRARVTSVVQKDDVSLCHPIPATPITDHAPAVPYRRPAAIPAPIDLASPSSRIVTTLDAVDPQLLREVRGAAYDAGYDAGYGNGSSDTFENLEWRLDERESEGYSRGKEDGLRTLRDEQCAARKKIETTRYWEGFGTAQQLYSAQAMLPAPEHVDTETQTSAPPAAPRADVPMQTDPLPLRVDTASQAEPDTIVNNITHENYKNNMNSRCNVSTTMISDMHHTTSANVNHCNIPVPTVDTPPAPTSFSWADDAEALPIPSVPPLPMQRDFSVLRSGTKTSPFGSLQRRARRAHRSSLLHPWSRPVVPPAPVVTRRHPAGLRLGKPFFTQMSSHSCVDLGVPQPAPLDWDGDPRLVELSRVLRSLGWVQSAVP